MRLRDLLSDPPEDDADPLDEGAPLTPEKARKRAARQVRIAQRIRDENSRHAAKLRDLRAGMADA